MAKKKDNNLVEIRFEDGESRYFTSCSKAGLNVGLVVASVQWAVNHGNVLTTVNDRKFTIHLVDGSEIPYKYINNN
jgi:hypothetical protein